MNLGILRRLFDAFYARPFLFGDCMCEVVHRERLPECGPAIIVANHKSLVDAAVIQMQYPSAMLDSIRPTGARDFFERKGRINYWMARDIMRICFVDREAGDAARAGQVDIFAEFHVPLALGNILIYFPQGTRDEGAPFKPGVFHLARTFPHVPIIPVLLEGTREMHPKGVPFYRLFRHKVKVHVGEEFVFDPSLTPRQYAKKLEDYVFSLDKAQV